jgi:hypothetical protein
MKKNIIGFLFLGLIFSCKEKTEVPFQNNIGKIVIEAEVEKDGTHSHCDVIVSTTNAFNDSIISVRRSIDWGTISDNLGNLDSLKMRLPNSVGFYEARNINAETGRTYYLTLSIDGKLYKSQATINAVPDIDSFYTWFFLTVKNKIPSIVFNDPASIKNYYRYHVSKNGVIPDRVEYVFEDKLINGTKWAFSSNQQFFDKGDTVVFRLLGIDKQNFDYWKILIQNKARTSGNNNSSSPTNPPSNIEGGNVLGYFSAHEAKSVKFVIN